jgi:RNA polymerase sigma-70 factor, ECF subfamily
MDDRQAIALLRQGDTAGLEVLVRRYQDRALRTAYLICLDVDMAQDVAQEAFLRTYRRIEQFDMERPFAPWFLRIVANQTLMAIRKQRRVRTLLDEALHESIPDPSPSIERVILNAETQDAVRDALTALSPKQRAAVVCRYYLGMGEAEMSELLGCPRGTIKRRLHDARQSLRRLLPTWVTGGTESHSID